ncbi:MAG TPA: hypothetical protein VHV74_10465 [Pseudonocardiaceae bacterium]|jgi:hypothetical protein|nr:hypothetical protein [Pseudonocardiaceae bacterium]
MDREEIAAVWSRSVAGDDSPLPGARLHAMVTPHGWCGQVTATRSSQVEAAADAIATAYDLPAGAVVVQRTGDDSSFVWAYSAASGADYHRQWPRPVIDGTEFSDVERSGTDGSSLLDFVRLTEMARKHEEDWRDLRSGQPVDVQRFVRRLTLLRAGVVDMLVRTRPVQIRELLLRVGVPAESLPADVLRLLDYPTRNLPTVPNARSVAFAADPDVTQRISS